MKSAIEVAEQCMTAIERTIKNALPTVSCPEKQQGVLWKRSEVKRILASRLQEPNTGMIGPQQTKATHDY